MKVLKKEELPKKKDWLPQIYLFLPLLVLLFMLVVLMAPAQRSAILAMAVILVLAFRSKEFWPTPRRLYKALADGGSSVISTILTCATAGIIVGCLNLTGLSVKLSSLIIKLGGDSLYLSLFLTMIVALILGMGMPPVAAYIIMASMIVPSLVKIGVPQLTADLFVFYYSCLGNVTPPVALATFTAAGLVNEDQFKTGLLAFRYSLITLIVPFAFIVSPTLLLQGNVLEIIFNFLTASIGLYAAAISLIGWWKGKINIVFRVLFFLGGTLMLVPGALTDLIGISVTGSLLAIVVYLRKKQGNTPSSTPLVGA